MAKLNLFYYVDPHIHIICYNIHWTSMTILCLYRVQYILEGKVPNNRATVVQRCKITWHTSSNSLMVAQHSHLSMRIILQPQEFMHHSCEYTQRCTMLVLMIVRPSAIESVAHGRLWISNMFKNQTRPQASGKSHATEATARATLASHRANVKKAGSQSALKWSCANCERGLTCEVNMQDDISSKCWKAASAKTYHDQSLVRNY